MMILCLLYDDTLLSYDVTLSLYDDTLSLYDDTFLKLENWAPSYVTSRLNLMTFQTFTIFHRNPIGTQALLVVTFHRSNPWIMEEILFGVISRNCQ